MDGITNYTNFLALHKPQLVLSGVPELFWPILCKKLQDQIFDSGSSFQLVQIDYEDTEKTAYDPLWTLLSIRDINKNDASHIYLVDHAWTFKANRVKNNLRNVSNLLDRMCNLMQISESDEEERIEAVSKNVWKYAHTYTINGDDFSDEDRVPVWYVLDELGSAINHSDEPNFHAVPFFHVPEQITYTLMFPILNVEEGESITRNFVMSHYSDPLQREATLIPWKQYNHFKDDFTQKEPDVNYFIEGHIVESLPNVQSEQIDRPIKFKVFSEYALINEYLTCNDFEIVDNENDADILWYLSHFKNYKELSEDSPQKFVNQFPYEYVITNKDLLATVARRAEVKYVDKNTLETYPLWLPTTFNMKTELSKLVSYYEQRKELGLDNHWICKPYNLARGLDTYITDNLNFLCRLPLSGPKVAQKYIENPVLFDRPEVGLVKFDIRYVILMSSVNPNKVHVYNNFFLRFSNKQFAMNSFEDYEQHFTVMNYNENTPLHRLLCHDFKTEWNRQYSNFDWGKVEKSIFSMIAELFASATGKNAPMGIGQSPQSRALYAADIMLSWHLNKAETVIQPKLLEVNWMPDCRRACEYYPEFYNDIFTVMFLNKEVSTCTRVL